MFGSGEPLVAIFADLFGEVWSFPIHGTMDNKSDLLLGHVSVLHDMVI
jgi:hypothetical protein